MKVTKEKLLLGLEVLLLCGVLVLALRPKTTLMSVDVTSDFIHAEQQKEIGAEAQVGIGVPNVDLPELSPGTYELLVSYEVAEDTKDEVTSYLQLRGSEDYFRSVLYNPVEFVADDNQVRMSFCLRDTATNLEAYLEGESAQVVNIVGMELVRTSGAARMVLVLLLLILIPINLLYVLYRYIGTHTVSKEQILVWIGVPAIALLASIPLFTDYLLASAELEQILHEIEAVAQGGEWNGDARVLWFPIMLRKLGFTLNLAYAVSSLLRNLCMVLVTYGIFKICFKRQVIAWLGCMFYTLAPWRLRGMYLSHDVSIWKILFGALGALTLSFISSRMLKCDNKTQRDIFFVVLVGGYLLVALSCINNMMLWTEGLLRMY